MLVNAKTTPTMPLQRELGRGGGSAGGFGWSKKNRRSSTADALEGQEDADGRQRNHGQQAVAQHRGHMADGDVGVAHQRQHLKGEAVSGAEQVRRAMKANNYPPPLPPRLTA